MEGQLRKYHGEQTGIGPPPPLEDPEPLKCRDVLLGTEVEVRDGQANGLMAAPPRQ